MNVIDIEFDSKAGFGILWEWIFKVNERTVAFSKTLRVVFCWGQTNLGEWSLKSLTQIFISCRAIFAGIPRSCA